MTHGNGARQLARALLVAAVLCVGGLSLIPADALATGSQSTQPVGFARAMSWEHGRTATFSLSGPVDHLDIYRMGTNGLNGTQVASITGINNVNQLACLQLPEGSADCGNWAVNASWPIPGNAPSAIYRAVPMTSNGAPGPDIWFVVRCDECHAPIVVMTSDETWQAYNVYGGGSLYFGATPDGQRSGPREHRVSYNRPLLFSEWSYPRNAEVAMLNWLTTEGYNFQYVSQLDVEENPSILLGHRIMVNVGHLEYVSDNQRAAIENAVAHGVSWANLTGNDFYWKIDPQASIDPSNQPGRTIVCYKETLDNQDINPSLIWTGTWRDRRFSPPNDGGRPENVLTGQLFTVDTVPRYDSIQFTAQEGSSPFLRNTAAAKLKTGQVLTMPAGTLGYEWDEVKTDNLTLPANELALSTAVVSGVNELQPDARGDYSQQMFVRDQTATHHVTLYQAPSGAWVWSAGTVQWSWGLSDDHVRFTIHTANPVMQQATVNIFIDMGVQPGKPDAGMVMSAPEPFSAYAATLPSALSGPGDFPLASVQHPPTIAGDSGEE
jgi:hypothetical protein